MAINDLYFKRAKRERGEYPDVYQYEELPEKLKIQIVHLWNETIGQDHSGINWGHLTLNREYLKLCYKVLCKENGVFKLNEDDSDVEKLIVYFESIYHYFLEEKCLEKSLSIIELMMQTIARFAIENRRNVDIDINDSINELNQRFIEQGVGYRYENDQIIKVDSEFIHTETVKPALQLLSNPLYKGAQQEFLKAHEHYRHGRYDSALSDCLKSFESTMKIILDKHDWKYDKKRDTASKLINCCLENELIPKFWTDHFTSLRNMLSSSIPTARNTLAGHGAGNESREIPEYLISYVLHMTASAIVFLIKAEENLPQ